MLTPWKESYDQPRKHTKKVETLLCQQRSIWSRLSFFQWSCMDGTIKKAECHRTDASELWCWRRLLRVPCTARRSNQSILKEVSPGCSLEGLMLKLKLQYFGHLMRRADSLERTLMLGKIEGRRRGDDRGWDGWMASPTQWTWLWVDSGSWWWTGRPGMLQFMGSQRVRHDWATELNWMCKCCWKQEKLWLIQTKRKTKWNLLNSYMSGRGSHVYPSVLAVPLFVAISEFTRMNWNHLLAALHRSSCFLKAELIF